MEPFLEHLGHLLLDIDDIHFGMSSTMRKKCNDGSVTYVVKHPDLVLTRNCALV